MSCESVSVEDCSILLEDLLQCLLESCEKAASIARIFRTQDDLFELLVEEKSKIIKNRRLVQDFKTLADVLVQETIKRDVGRKFPTLLSKIQGEEQNTFQNALGEFIKIELTDSQEETVSLLCKVLDERVQIAESLAVTVHSSETVCRNQFSFSVSISTDRIGIWIDPIDSTAEYIQAKETSAEENGIQLYGLKCVCVLIGVYDLKTGLPIMGIINQPFYKQISTLLKWESNIYWGICCNFVMETSSSLRNESEKRMKIVVTSSFEKQELESILRSKYTIVHAAGAGYKCLVVAKMIADLYVLSLPNTHFWDTCGPHAILVAQGGGIVNFKQIINSSEVLDHSNIQNYQLKYLEDSENPAFRNTGGFIAYRDLSVLLELLELLRERGYQHI